MPASGDYFGRIEGSPPGLPGGGITGVLPTSGAVARISGSTPAGGHRTPSDWASLSPSGWLVTVPPGTAAPGCGAGCIGAQLVARTGDGGAVWAGGVTGPGGACAEASPEAAIRIQDRNTALFIPMQGNGARARMFP